jgi:hypothetical protein
MSFCCGASMIGAFGTMKHQRSYIHDVPILYCPVCQKVEVHPSVREEYDILSDYAQSDKAPEVYFSEYVEVTDKEALFEDCIDVDASSAQDMLRSQIDNALDLLSLAKNMKDSQWQEQLYQRLKVLSKRLKRYEREAKQGHT